MNTKIMLRQWTRNKDRLHLQVRGALGKDKGANTNMEKSAPERVTATLHNCYQLNNDLMLWQLWSSTATSNRNTTTIWW
jgi:hypothetical protein